MAVENSGANTLIFLHNYFIRGLFVVPILATLTAWLCFYHQVTLELRALVTIFFAGVFFAFAVIMNTANVRRFQALDELALIKSVTLSFWQVSNVYLQKQEKTALKQALVALTESIHGLLKREVSVNSLHQVDQSMNQLMADIEIVRAHGMQTPEVSRLLQWHQQVYLAVEKLLMIKEKRTPLSLRLFVAMVLVIALFVLAPQFALFGYYGVVASAIVSTVMVLLIWIQDMLEHPFGNDIDHIEFRDVERFYGRLQ